MKTLNYGITFSEVKNAVMNAKIGKSAGSDMIHNEILKFNQIMKVLYTMFNVFFDYGMVAAKWLESIIPKGTQDDKGKRIPKNYRRISLLSCVFSSILNDRIVKHLRNRINQNKCTFVAFLDLRKAFDSVKRLPFL